MNSVTLKPLDVSILTTHWTDIPPIPPHFAGIAFQMPPIRRVLANAQGMFE